MKQFTFEQLPQAVTELAEKLNAIHALLVNQTDAPFTPTNDLLTITQAADFLTLSKFTIYGLVQRREVPFSKRGKRLYFSKQDLIDWIKTGSKSTIIEMQSRATDFLTTPKIRK
jgi:excisionase family DNA binding protein